MDPPKRFMDSLLENGERLADYIAEILTLDKICKLYEFRERPSNIDNFLSQVEIALLLGDYEIKGKYYTVHAKFYDLVEDVLKEKKIVRKPHPFYVV